MVDSNIRFDTWTPIAQIAYDTKNEETRWVSTEGAPFTLKEAREMERNGIILLANKRVNNQIYVVVKSRKPVDDVTDGIEKKKPKSRALRMNDVRHVR